MNKCKSFVDNEPGSDYGLSKTEKKKLVEVLDGLQGQICDIQGAVHHISKELGIDLSQTNFLRTRKLHRDDARNRALMDLDRTLNKLDDNVQRIKDLGGIPSASTKDRINSLLSSRRLIQQSDPLNCDLY